MKKWIKVILCLIVLTGCGNQGTPNQVDPPKSESFDEEKLQFVLLDEIYDLPVSLSTFYERGWSYSGDNYHNHEDVILPKNQYFTFNLIHENKEIEVGVINNTQETLELDQLDVAYVNLSQYGELQGKEVTIINDVSIGTPKKEIDAKFIEEDRFSSIYTNTLGTIEISFDLLKAATPVSEIEICTQEWLSSSLMEYSKPAYRNFTEFREDIKRKTEEFMPQGYQSIITQSSAIIIAPNLRVEGTIVEINQAYIEGKVREFQVYIIKDSSNYKYAIFSKYNEELLPELTQGQKITIYGNVKTLYKDSETVLYPAIEPMLIDDKEGNILYTSQYTFVLYPNE